MAVNVNPMDFYTEEIAVCRPWDIPQERLSSATAWVYFRDRGLLKLGCRTAVGEDEVGCYVKLWRWLPKTASRAGRWKRKLNADSIPMSRVINLCDDGQDGKVAQAGDGYITSHPLGLTEGQLTEAGNPLFGRASLFRVSLPEFGSRVTPPEHEPEKTAFQCLRQGWTDSHILQRILHQLPGRAKTRNEAQHQGLDEYVAKTWTTGAFSHGPKGGLMSNCRVYPWVTILLVSLVNEVADKPDFTSITLNSNTMSCLHTDSHNLKGTPNIAVPLTLWSGGELFLRDASGTDRLQPSGVKGRKLQILPPFLSFDGSIPHATCPWKGNRLLLIAYHVRNPENIPGGQLDILRGFGFNVRMTADPE